ncbi:putative membrane protein YfcA [Thermosporothrix hazakensis]|jgi:uncharacterized membrane protein YfcA/uncharacterized membrane protein|uniref:Probable membrane transporter protein n=2 Tax=Thermosporothrix TaxID=768650 RepID=A0A326UQW6_THEHA|nr:TSUP family transporter [Thermosporothrix hazakensis]PZW32867.1 putative membrane protein YfcA [Thermosporothrix hazakensis]BBH90848.1 hypothetical protein KTC_55990 [Thermosporothrix sp. COM3]GCE48899.1 hypothetical protein KTH_37680 [Thermosporothrix hazakensis]
MKTTQTPPQDAITGKDTASPIENKRLLANDIIGWILQGGVLLSAAIIILGLGLFLGTGGLAGGNLLDFPSSFGQLLTGLLSLQSQSIIALGLFILILTPVIRVTASIIIFALEHDLQYVIITCIVLAILLFSMLTGNAEGSSSSAPTTALTHNFSLSFSAFIFLGAILAGVLGSLLGLGGGILIVPMLTLIFKLPIQYAIGASIISVIATSSGAAAAYVRDRVTNMRIGMFLELGTTIGAISGAFLATLLAPGILSILFAIILIITAIPMIFKIGEEVPQGVKNDRWANWLKLSSSYPDRYLKREISYQVTRTPIGLLIMYIAGTLSGLLGIGSGVFKVTAMDLVMRLPMKVSTTTSNFMIGVTAAASAAIYFARGDILPLVAAPVALGILAGAFIGSRLLMKLSSKTLRYIFLPVILITAIQMFLKGIGVM